MRPGYKSELQQQPMRKAALIAQRADTMARLRGDDEDENVLVKASACSKTLAAFDPPVLEHLRQSNLAAYQTMLENMKKDIMQVVKNA